MYRRQVWYSDPLGRTSSGSVTPETPSMSTETKTFTHSLLFLAHVWQLPVDERTLSRYKYYSRPGEAVKTHYGGERLCPIRCRRHRPLTSSSTGRHYSNRSATRRS